MELYVMGAQKVSGGRGPNTVKVLLRAYALLSNSAAADAGRGMG